MLAIERDGITTASLAPIIVCGSSAELYQLWLEQTGQAPREPMNDNYPVQHGKHLEPFVLDWVERNRQQEITERQKFIRHPTLPKIGCTLDGFLAAENAVIEVKVLNPFTAANEFVPYYAPQVLVQMRCRGAARGILAVQQGNSPPQQYEINVDEPYERSVFERLAAFQLCCDLRTPPGPPPPAPVPPEQWRSVDLDASPKPNWGHAMMPTLRLWSDTKEAHDMHEQAKTDVKVLLPDDVGRVTWGNITVSRSRNGAVTIREAA